MASNCCGVVKVMASVLSLLLSVAAVLSSWFQYNPENNGDVSKYEYSLFMVQTPFEVWHWDTAACEDQRGRHCDSLLAAQVIALVFVSFGLLFTILGLVAGLQSFSTSFKTMTVGFALLGLASHLAAAFSFAYFFPMRHECVPDADGKAVCSYQGGMNSVWGAVVCLTLFAWLTTVESNTRAEEGNDVAGLGDDVNSPIVANYHVMEDQPAAEPATGGFGNEYVQSSLNEEGLMVMKSADGPMPAQQPEQLVAIPVSESITMLPQPESQRKKATTSKCLCCTLTNTCSLVFLAVIVAILGIVFSSQFSANPYETEGLCTNFEEYLPDRCPAGSGFLSKPGDTNPADVNKPCKMCGGYTCCGSDGFNGRTDYNSIVKYQSDECHTYLKKLSCAPCAPTSKWYVNDFDVSNQSQISQPIHLCDSYCHLIYDACHNATITTAPYKGQTIKELYPHYKDHFCLDVLRVKSVDAHAFAGLHCFSPGAATRPYALLTSLLVLLAVVHVASSN